MMSRGKPSAPPKRNTMIPFPSRARASSQRANPSLERDLPATSSATTCADGRSVFQSADNSAGWRVAHLDFVYRHMASHPGEIVVDGFANAALFHLADGENDDAHPRARLPFGDFAGHRETLGVEP